MRAPDLIIGNPERPTYYRWQLFKVRGFQLCLHKWLRSDDDRALHDHSGDSVSLILNGGYYEVVRHYDGLIPDIWYNKSAEGHMYVDIEHWRRPWWPVLRKAETPHRVVLSPFYFERRSMMAQFKPVWSLWFRWPPRREWGFHCPKGWRHWKDFVASREDYYKTKTSEVGPGCD